jgi:uncharacterized NAD(P)/FAD-binding protein YdhS
VSNTRTIAIVGAGFCGALAAVHLLRAAHRQRTRIVLIERAAAIGRGTAYAEREDGFLLNVPAARMSADSQQPLDFLHFAQRHAQHRLPKVTAEDYLPRALYGEYLEATLRAAEARAPSHVHCERLRAEVHGVQPKPASTALLVRLADGQTLLADDVVLALGNPPPGEPVKIPAELCQPRNQESTPRYVADPWSQPLGFQPHERLLLIGSGLTMADVACAAAQASSTMRIHAISRHGLLPSPQTHFASTVPAVEPAELLQGASFSALTLFRIVRELADETQRRGGDWRETITLVRNLAPQLWSRLKAHERQRLLRHVRPYWDIHRHRLPPATAHQLQQMLVSQQLQLHAGRILQLQLNAEHLSVQWRARSASEVHSLQVDRIINCTGPDYDVTRSREPLLRSLLQQQLATPDVLRLGLRTAEHGALLDSRGQQPHRLYYLGPMLRAAHWEATAAQELRGHAESLARHLASLPVQQPVAPLLRVNHAAIRSLTGCRYDRTRHLRRSVSAARPASHRNPQS